MNILHIDSSILGEHSVSRRLSAAAVRRLTQLSPNAHVVYRDLAARPIPQFSPELVQIAMGASPAGAGAHDAQVVGEVLDELLAADVVVIGAPMYNFTVPSQLKSWLDAVVVAGKTFKYDANGVQGLLGGKRAIIASSRGGYYGPDSNNAVAEHHETYLRSLLGFIGIQDIQVVRAEGVRMGPEIADAAIAAALVQAERLQLAA